MNGALFVWQSSVALLHVACKGALWIASPCRARKVSKHAYEVRRGRGPAPSGRACLHARRRVKTTPANTLVIAEPFEPQTLDPTTNTIDLITTITQNVFEPLYAFDRTWQPAPILAAGPAKISEDAKKVTIPLRQGVKFHNGQTMSSADVVASLQRWQKLSPRGKLAAEATRGRIRAVDEQTVEIRLKQPFAPLLSLLSFFNAAAAMMPKAEAEGAMDGPIRDIGKYIGTGPFLGLWSSIPTSSSASSASTPTPDRRARLRASQGSARRA